MIESPKSVTFGQCNGASMWAMIRYKLDYRYAAEIFSSTAILCMLTIPVMVFLADRLLGW